MSYNPSFMTFSRGLLRDCKTSCNLRQPSFQALAQVPEFGWSEQSRAAVEENCLVWVVEMAGAGAEDGWHGASCCNMHQYVCQLL